MEHLVNVRPLVVGYQRLRARSSPEQVENDRRVICAYAERTGYALGLTYIDHGPDYGALEQVLHVLARGEACGVIVASEGDLGDLGRVRNYVRARIEGAGGRLLIAQGLNAGGVDVNGGRDGWGARLAVDPLAEPMMVRCLRSPSPLPRARRAVPGS
jgi:hypothetical protein